MNVDEKKELLKEILRLRGVDRTSSEFLMQMEIIEDKRETIERDGEEYEMIFQVLADKNYIEYIHLKQQELKIGEPWIRNKRPDFLLLKEPDVVCAVEVMAHVDPVDLMTNEDVFKLDYGDTVLLQGFGWNFKMDVHVGIFHPLVAQWDEMNLDGWFDFDVTSVNIHEYLDVEMNQSSSRYLQEVLNLRKADCGRLDSLLRRFGN